MPILLPLPWRFKNSTSKTNRRLMIVYHGHYRLALATAEGGKLLDSVATFNTRSRLDHVLPAKELVSHYMDHIQRNEPTKILFLWTQEKENATLSRMFTTGQLYAHLKTACDALGKSFGEFFLRELKHTLFQDEFVSNQKIVEMVKAQFPDMNDDQAMAAFVAITKTAPSPFNKKLAL